MPILDIKQTIEYKGNPAGTVKAYRAYNVTPDINKIDTIANATRIGKFSSDRAFLGGRRTELGFTHLLAGFDADTGDCPYIGYALMASGMSWSSAGCPNDEHVFTLGDQHFFDGDIEGDLTPLDIAHNTGTLVWRSQNTILDPVFTFKAGEVPYVTFKGEGNYTGPVSAVSQSAFFKGETPLAVMNEGFIITQDGGSPIPGLSIVSFEFAPNNKIMRAPSMNATYGYDRPYMDGRDPRATIVLRMPETLSIANFETLLTDQLPLNFAFTHNSGGTAGNVIDVEFDGYIENLVYSYEGARIITLNVKQSEDDGDTQFTVSMS
jgi:hypothetical protein